MFKKSQKTSKTRSAQDTKNWYKDRYQYVLVWRNIMVVFTLISLVISLVSVTAVRQLTPLKSVEPFVIQVEDKTGITQVVNPITAKELSATEAVNDFFVIQYVKARETYDIGSLQANYDTVRVMSEPSVIFKEYSELLNTRNPASVVNRLGNTGTRRIQIKGVTYLPSTPPSVLAQARILVEEVDNFKKETRQYHKAALVEFRYEAINLTAQERYINPLGFIVYSYSLNEDALVK